MTLRVSELEFAYTRGASEGFSLQVPELELDGRVALVGPSGSGKTTLLHLCGGVLAPRRGAVVAGDVDLTALGEAARRRWRMTHVGLVFQSFELLAHLSVEENILLPYLIGGGPALDGDARARALELARAAGIARYMKRPPARLSHGERQRVAVCRALVVQPRVLLADEPTANLDAATADTVLGLLLDPARAGLAVVVTHDQRLLPRFDRVVDIGPFSRRPAPAEGAAC